MSYACGFLPTVFDEYPCSRLGSSTTSRVMSLSSRSLRRVAQAGQVPSGFLKKIALYTWWIKAQKRSNQRDFCISGSNDAKPIHHDWNMSIVSWEMNSDRREGPGGPDCFKKKNSNLSSWLPAKWWRDGKFTNDVDFYGHIETPAKCFDHIFPHSKEKNPIIECIKYQRNFSLLYIIHLSLVDSLRQLCVELSINDILIMGADWLIDWWLDGLMTNPW